MALPFLCAQGNLGGHRVAVAAGVGRIQQFHGPEVDLAALEHQAQEVVQAQVLTGRHGGQTLVDEGIDLFVFLPQDPGVVGIGADPFDAEEQGVLQGQDIGIGGGIGFEAHRFGLLDQAVQGGGGVKGGRAGAEIDLAPALA